MREIDRMKKLLAAALALLMLAGCASSSPKPSESTTPPAPESSAPAEPTEDKAWGLDDPLSSESFDVTVVSAELSDKVTLNAGVDIDFSPDEGKQFLILCIDAKNTSDEVCNLGSFLASVDKTSVFPSNYLGKLGTRVLFVGAVPPGSTMETYVLYQVPEEWKVFELWYIDSLLGGTEGPIVISREDVK